MVVSLSGEWGTMACRSSLYPGDAECQFWPVFNIRS